MRKANWILWLTVFVTLVGWLHVDGPLAQDDARKALLGVWEGTLTQGTGSAEIRLSFSEEGDKLVWKWNVHSRRSSFQTEAEGTVMKYSASSLEMSGHYTFHSQPRIQGSPVTMSLTVTDNRIQGTGLTAAVNRTFSLSLTRK